MVLGKIAAAARRKCAEFLRCEDGNVLLLTVFSLPMIIGGAGMGVDMAQWYLWQREAQYAVDQAAISAAYTMRDNEEGVLVYEDIARLAYWDNLSITHDLSAEPEFTLANWASGDLNSVIAKSSVTNALPFTGFFLKHPVTISVTAQAAFEKGVQFTSCLIATDEDDDGAVTIGGNTTFTAGCGIAALSDSDQAVLIDGNPTVEAGWVLSKGGIDDWFDYHTSDEIHEYIDGLKDPFEGLTPPDDPRERLYECQTTGKGSDKSKVATLLPGTYTEIVTRCNTTLQGGIYVIDGGSFEVRAQDVVVGTGVMIVLRNGARIHINGGAEISLTAMSVSELMAEGVSQEDAQLLEGLLIFEDPRSQSSEDNVLNGNAATILNGAVYLPRSALRFSGTAGMTTQCLMIVANTIKLTGDTTMSAFCPSHLTHDEVVAEVVGNVILIS
ncbi:pilus assembly protein TadG-related protein [Croceicoccus gelatinilyticus]|uniref:pilus assembly protein TadG-related protein n=1 Tax=Croceicoccus gelatinilyticus TaxID=2835536 RepID=UPI001BCD267C|nr:pilus assembly protein TadG-related protein [Croceicoccus gelatinilyticus]MBS7671417.1 hypothetical protein [Croceicoccus gelatinilyticus]